MDEGRPSPRPIKRILIANRGEIAVRILYACRELPTKVETFALYTKHDKTHLELGLPDHALDIPSPVSYTDIDFLVKLTKEHNIDAVHPGYGFLSENAEFAQRMCSDAGALVIGPGWGVLERTGNKLKAKRLAAECDVPTLPALKEPTEDVQVVHDFAREVGLPVMVKAVDGGGGRAIRLVTRSAEMENAVQRALGESPSRKVFAEKAAVDGFRHIEVQIVGEGNGRVQHLWERDCSIQRRFQKVVEIAPAPVKSRTSIAEAINGALKMAKKVKYLGLGTWEFLINVETGYFFFLEINPRLQVEHTITEGISGVDLVVTQLLLAQGWPLRDLNLLAPDPARSPPNLSSMQLRICAEDPAANFALSIGKISDCRFPSGLGIRVETYLVGGLGGVVEPDFDNLMVKIIVTGKSWTEMLQKARRALEDTKVVGVKTNIPLLRAILVDNNFVSSSIDNQWLEMRLPQLLEQAAQISQRPHKLNFEYTSSSLPLRTGTAGALFRKGDGWSIDLHGVDENGESDVSYNHHLVIDRIARNDFPESLTADITYTASSATGPSSQSFKAIVNSTKASADALASRHRRGDPTNRNHLIIPMSGKLIEVLIEEGDIIQVDQAVAFVKQMKMELAIRSPRAGKIKWSLELENDGGDDVAEGTLLAELAEVDNDAQSAATHKDLKGRL